MKCTSRPNCQCATCFRFRTEESSREEEHRLIMEYCPGVRPPLLPSSKDAARSRQLKRWQRSPSPWRRRFNDDGSKNTRGLTDSSRSIT